jgi:HSP20 family molecular chaperone IbpA
MRAERDGNHTRASERVKLTIIGADEQTRRMQKAVARRAYAIFESRGSASWHELEDWRQAERELVSPLCCGRMTVGDSLWVGADAAVFEEGTIEIWVAPRKITICGKPRMDKVDAHPRHIGRRPGGEMIFHVLDLSVEVDPSHVTAKFNGASLDILLRKADAEPKAKREVKAIAAQQRMPAPAAQL